MKQTNQTEMGDGLTSKISFRHTTWGEKDYVSISKKEWQERREFQNELQHKYNDALEKASLYKSLLTSVEFQTDLQSLAVFPKKKEYIQKKYGIIVEVEN